MTDDDLHRLYGDLDAYLRLQRWTGNVEPVSPKEAQWARRMLAGGTFSGGRCDQCGETKLHAHPVRDEAG